MDFFLIWSEEGIGICRLTNLWAWSRFQYPPLHCLTWTQNSVIKWLAPTSFCKECWLLQNDLPNKKHAFYKMAGFTGQKSLQNGSFSFKNAVWNGTWVQPFHSGHVHRDVNGRIGSQCSMDIVGLGMPPGPTDFFWPWESDIFRGKSFFMWYLAGSSQPTENDSYRPIHITDWSCFGIKHSFRLDCLVSTKYFVSLVSLKTNFFFCIKHRSSGSSFEFETIIEFKPLLIILDLFGMFQAP